LLHFIYKFCRQIFSGNTIYSRAHSNYS